MGTSENQKARRSGGLGVGVGGYAWWMDDEFDRFVEVMKTALRPLPYTGEDPTAYVRTWTPPGAEEEHQRLREALGLTDDQEVCFDWTPLLGDRA